MTNTSDESQASSVSSARPQVIDLEAEDITVAEEPQASEKSHAGPADDPPAPSKRNAMGPWRFIAGAALLGLLAGGWLYRDVLSAYLPSAAMAELEARVATLEAQTRTGEEQVEALGATLEKTSAALASLEGAVKSASEGESALRGTVESAAARVAAVEEALADIRQRLDAIPQAGSGGTDSAALAAFASRLADVERQVADLKAGTGATGDGALAASLRQALSDLRAKIAAGQAYGPELGRIVRLVPAAGGNGALEAHAEKGLANGEGLAEELRALIPSLPEAAPAAEEQAAGTWASFWNTITSIVSIRDVGATDWRDLAQRSAEAAQVGDLAGAVALIDSAAAPAALSSWRERAAARLALEAALPELGAAVERVIAAMGEGQ
jgi:hypothetical protein